jgi:hypothetical protein
MNWGGTAEECSFRPLDESFFILYTRKRNRPDGRIKNLEKKWAIKNFQKLMFRCNWGITLSMVVGQGVFQTLLWSCKADLIRSQTYVSQSHRRMSLELHFGHACLLHGRSDWSAIIDERVPRYGSRTDHAGMLRRWWLNDRWMRQDQSRRLRPRKIIEKTWEWKKQLPWTIVTQIRRLGGFLWLGSRAFHIRWRSFKSTSWSLC